MVRRQSYQERVLASTGRDPLRCPRCGGSMMLWQIWHPRYGVVYDEVEQIKRGRYDPGGGVLPGANVAEERRDSGDQLGWSFIGMGEAIRDDYEGCAWGVEPSLL